ncbi:MAG: hypothetical protein Q7S02_05665, partial [bacterium]|nr:hypothetical protein [bacterium]
MTHGVIASAVNQSRSSSTAFAALAGFFLPWQTVWILRPGMLGGVPWPLATIGLYASDVVLLVAAVIGLVRLLRSTPPSPPSEGGGETNKFSPLPDGRGSGRGWGSRRLPIAFGLLISLATVNTAASVDPWLSAVGWVRIIAFLLAFAGLPYSERATRAFLGGFLVAMLGHVALGFWQFATGHGFASTLLGTAAHDAFVRGDSVLETLDGRGLRAYGGFPHPNVFGVALLAALAALVRWSLASPPSPPSREGGKEKNSPLLPEGEREGVCAVLHSTFCILIFALVFTFSRAALLGLIVFLAILARRMVTRRFAAVGVLTLVAATAVTWTFWVPRVT